MNEAATVSMVARLPVLGFSIQIALLLVMAGIGLTVLRLIRGPSPPDRMAALHASTVMAVAFCGLSVLGGGSTTLLDLAGALALLGFLVPVVWARHVERRGDRPPSEGRAPAPSPDPAPDFEELP